MAKQVVSPVTIYDRKNRVTWFVCYARFCGNRCESFGLTRIRSEAGHYDERQARLIRARSGAV